MSRELAACMSFNWQWDPLQVLNVEFTIRVDQPSQPSNHIMHMGLRMLVHRSGSAVFFVCLFVCFLQYWGLNSGPSS
jgi:hypothetical protein